MPLLRRTLLGFGLLTENGWSFAQDSTLEFEKRRNVPVRYNRELVQKTLEAMDRIAEIKARRERAFYRARMARASGGSVSKARKTRDQREVARSKHLEPAIRAERQQRLAEEARRQDVRVRIKAKQQRAKRSALVPGSGTGM